MDEHFLLTTGTAQEMYIAAKNAPIFDWHCHLSPKEIYEDKPFANIGEMWLAGDHYKWRGMRSCGVNEELITGTASWEDKFKAFAACLPKLIGNPLYHWAHLELQAYFGIHTPLSEKTADEIWTQTLELLSDGSYTPRSLIERSNVYALCTTDDPADSLEYHEALLKEDLPYQVLPAFRPDRALAIEAPAFTDSLAALEARVGHAVKTFADLCAALSERIEFFASLGCKACDHAFSYVPYAEAAPEALEGIFAARLAGETLDAKQLDQYRTALMRYLAAEYTRREWGMELHIGPMRNNNRRMFETFGPDGGFDSIDDPAIARPLSAFLGSLDYDGILPRTILFNLNPKDSYTLGTMIGNFQGTECPGKLQYGPAWWFLDHIDGMTAQLQQLGSLGALATFVGMVTDSRSFTSYPRHDYFRRIFCALVGEWVESGKFPNDTDFLKQLAFDVSFGNAKDYFGI
jgi:glucuronate isomerase